MRNLFAPLSGLIAGCFGAWGTLQIVEPTPISTAHAPVVPAQLAHLPARAVPVLPESSFVEAAAASVDAVVHVRTLQRSQASAHPWYELFGYGTPERIAQGSGSGVIIDSDGHIVTNYHVIEEADEIVISLNNNRTYKADIIGTDPSTDLAVLKIDAPEALPSLPIGSSSDVKVGEWVLAVGNPFDLTSTVTAGIVSAKARDIDILRGDPRTREYPVESFIQTDAAVNPGNSGGALVNARGELIGINTAIASRTGSYSGYSFAVPSTIVEKVVGDLLTFGEVRRAYLGIQIEPVDEALAESLGLDEVSGCAVVGVVPGSGADEADMQAGDVVLAIDGAPISNFPELQECIAKYHPGDRVQVALSRDGRAQTMQVKLTNIDGSSNLSRTANNTREQTWIPDASAGLSTASETLKSSLGIGHGVQVSSLAPGTFSQAGIRKGFIITKINGEEIENAQQVGQAFSDSDEGLLVEGVYPDGQKAYYGMAATP